MPSSRPTWDLNKVFVKNLKSVIYHRKLTKAELHRLTGLASTHIDGILGGSNGMTLKTVGRICKALRVDPTAMFDQYQVPDKEQGFGQ